MRIAGLGVPELLLILGIVLLVFGIGRIGKIGGELGTAIRQFRDGLQGPKDGPKDDTKPDAPKSETTE